MSWTEISNILIIFFTFIGTCGTGFLVWKACQKPKARLRFADGKKEITLCPHYYNELSTKYYIVPWPNFSEFDRYHKLGEEYQKKHEKDNEFILSFRFENTGTLQLEDYRVDLEWNNGIQSTGYVQGKPRKVIGNYIEPEPLDSLSFNRGKPQITFSPLDKRPLNQKDFETFAFRFTPFADAEKIELFWHIVAKDFSDRGKFVIYLKPKISKYDKIIPVYRNTEVPDGAEKIEDLAPYIKQFEELLKED